MFEGFLSGYSNVEQLPSSIGDVLKHLRFLNLSHTRIRILPESISKLYNLQTLNLIHVGVSKSCLSIYAGDSRFCSSLQKLKICGYSGERFPNWFRGDSLVKIVFLEFSRCKFCSSLPPLGQLPSLKTLYISGFEAVVTVGPQFYGDSFVVKLFSSLEILRFRSMSTWERWIPMK